MKLSVVSLLSVSVAVVSAKLVVPEDRQLRMGMMKKSNSKGGKSGKTGKSTVELVDTSAELTTLVYNNLCIENPPEFLGVCTAQGGYPSILFIPAPTILFTCCPSEAFDIPAIVAYGQASTTDPTSCFCVGGTNTAPAGGIIVGGQLWCLPPSTIACI